MSDPRAAFWTHILKAYNLSREEYLALYRAQGGRCYVCRTATGPTKKRPKAKMLGVDHDHLTGEVRGLVCTGSLTAMTCNRLIAIFTRAKLLRAAAMLSDPPPARAVLSGMRAEGFSPTESLLPSLVGGEPFLLSEVRGADA